MEKSLFPSPTKFQRSVLQGRIHFEQTMPTRGIQEQEALEEPNEIDDAESKRKKKAAQANFYFSRPS